MTDKYLSPLVSCLHCKEVKSAKGLFTHYEFAHNKANSNYLNCQTQETRKSRSRKAKERAKLNRQQKLEEYESDKKYCSCCGIALDFDIRKQKFCSRSCSAKSNNAIRLKSGKPYHTEESKEKIRSKLKRPKVEVEIVGPYTKIFLCRCKFTGVQWYSTTIKTIHPNLARTKEEYSYSCKFSFSLRKYPSWFQTASELITEYGWYSTHGSIS